MDDLHAHEPRVAAEAGLTKRATGRVPTVEYATTTACSAGRLRSTFSPVRASSVRNA
jgi:hypothetical protein